jgi:predicted NBD/HSP70 family sugar kinase
LTGNSFYSLEKNADGRSGGTTQAETRVYNERLVLSLIRRGGRLAKSELTVLTGLSAQTVSTIVNRAADAGLLQRHEPIRGRRGQPSVPYSLAPEGVYSFGLKIDRRSADVALINFLGELVAFERITFGYPKPDVIMTFARAAIGRILAAHPEVSAPKIGGLGIASPFHLWNWTEEVGAPPGGLNDWQQVDIRAELDKSFDWPVYLFNDAMVSAAAELMFGSGVRLADFLYVYIGYFVGGGLVIAHHLFPGRNNRAGSIGEIEVPTGEGSNKGTDLLMYRASLHNLAKRIDGRAAEIWATPDKWPDLEPALSEWIEQAADGLAHAIKNAVAVIDVDHAILDGAIPAEVRKRIVRVTRQKLAELLVNRPEPFSVIEGTYGHAGPAIGGATIPFLFNYSNDRDLLFKA